MAPRLSGQNSIFGVVFFVSKSLLGIETQKKLEKFAILTRKPRSHARILIYRTWPIKSKLAIGNRDSLALVFPRSASATCYDLLGVFIGSLKVCQLSFHRLVLIAPTCTVAVHSIHLITVPEGNSFVLLYSAI